MLDISLDIYRNKIILYLYLPENTVEYKQKNGQILSLLLKILKQKIGCIINFIRVCGFPYGIFFLYHCGFLTVI